MGFQGKFHRQNVLSRFTKDLVRRSRSRCELCGEGGVRLDPYELPPIEPEPLIDRCVFVCQGCLKQIAEPRKMVPSRWRFLNTALYSEVPAVQVMSVRMLRRIAKREAWAEDLLEHAYLDPATQRWTDQAE